MDALPVGLQIFQYWHDDDVPDYIAGLCGTFASRNPDLCHRLFSESAAAEFIAAHFGPRELAAFRACAVPAMQADYFRYCAVLARGGVYADADYRCLGPMRPLIEDDSDAWLLSRGPTTVLGGASTSSVLNSFLLFKQPGHSLLEMVLSMATSSIERRRGADGPARSILFLTGPILLTGLRLAYELGSLEALSDLFRGTRFEPLERDLREAIGEYDRLADAFRRVRLATIEECGVVGEADRRLPYRSTEDHWAKFKAPIYRSEA